MPTAKVNAQLKLSWLCTKGRVLQDDMINRIYMIILKIV
jgi:hypothetical protein